MRNLRHHEDRENVVVGDGPRARPGLRKRDLERVRVLKDLIARGHLEQLLISQDVCLKMLLKTYGGWGYDHILLNVAPLMLREGIPQAAIDQLLYHNPARLIAYLD